MIQVSCLKPRDKTILRQLGYNPKEFLRVKKSAEGFVYMQIRTGKVLPIRA